MSAPNDFAWYEAALRGDFGALLNGQSEPGFYRDRRKQGVDAAVAVWRENGFTYARVGGAGSPVEGADDTFFERTFTRVCRLPIPEALYWAVVDEGKPWPDVPPEREARFSNLPTDPREALALELAGEQAEVEAWLKQVGEIATKADADRAANWADRLAASEARAEELRVEAKKPIVDEGRRIDGLWTPVRDGFKALKRRLKDATVPFQVAERGRIEAERAKALAAGEPAPARQAKVSAGTTGRRVALRTVKTAVIENPSALAAFLVEQRNPELLELMQALANRMVRAGAKPPGCSVQETQQAA